MKTFIILLFFISGCTDSNPTRFKCVNLFDNSPFLSKQKADEYCAEKSGRKIKLVRFKAEALEEINKLGRNLLEMTFKNDTGDYVTALIDRNGEGYPAYFFDNGADYFSDGLSRIISDKKIGFIDQEGKLVIEPEFTFAYPFENGFSKACQKCRYVKNGEYTSVESDNWFFINKKGIKFTKLPKVITLPFEDKFQEKVFGEDWLENTPSMRSRLKELCKKDKKACVNYIAAIFEQDYALKPSPMIDVTDLTHFSSFTPDKEKASNGKLIKYIENLARQNQMIGIYLAFIYYFEDKTNKAFNLLSNYCSSSNRESCFFLAWLQTHQLDYADAIESYNKACNLKLEEACFNKKVLIRN